jgi:hypothetical protein
VKPSLKTVIAAATLAALAAVAMVVAQERSETGLKRAHFLPDGSVVRPVGWREWVHVGTRYKPIGVNILDQKVTSTPEILNAYVEPSAMALFQQTGLWPEGAQIIKEFTAVKVGAGCDLTTLYVKHDLDGPVSRINPPFAGVTAVWALPAARSST